MYFILTSDNKNNYIDNIKYADSYEVLKFYDDSNICSQLGAFEYIQEVTLPPNETNINLNNSPYTTSSLCLHESKSLLDVNTWKWMISNNIDITVDSNRALRWASRNGHELILKTLLDNGACCTDMNNEALKWASLSGYVGIINLLLENGAGDIIEAIEWAKRGQHKYIATSLKICLIESKYNINRG